MLKENLEKPANVERRAWVRVPCNLEAMYQPGQGRLDHMWWFAQVRDLSPRGIGLLLERRLEPGTRLSIALNSTSQDVSKTLEADVIHVSPQSGQVWLTGCSFVSTLNDDEFGGLWSDPSMV
jgi:hypothetical protein